MQLNIKKPSELKAAQPIEIQYIYSTTNGLGIATNCPKCGAEHEFINDWPIDIPVVCHFMRDETDECGCYFIIKNDTPIED